MITSISNCCFINYIQVLAFYIPNDKIDGIFTFSLRSAQEDQANVRKLLETPGKFAEELKYLFRPA